MAVIQAKTVQEKLLKLPRTSLNSKIGSFCPMCTLVCEREGPLLGVDSSHDRFAGSGSGGFCGARSTSPCLYAASKPTEPPLGCQFRTCRRSYLTADTPSEHRSVQAGDKRGHAEEVAIGNRSAATPGSARHVPDDHPQGVDSPFRACHAFIISRECASQVALH